MRPTTTGARRSSQASGGTLEATLKEFRAAHPDKKFDYVDLSYDVVRDASGNPLRIEVPRLNGVGAFGARSDYYVTNTIRNCDFLISVPVMKVHENCGITGCFKNYVGTGPRCVYATPGTFWNADLHNELRSGHQNRPVHRRPGGLPSPRLQRGGRNSRTAVHRAQQRPARPDVAQQPGPRRRGRRRHGCRGGQTPRLQPADIDYLQMGAARGLGHSRPEPDRGGGRRTGPLSRALGQAQDLVRPLQPGVGGHRRTANRTSPPGSAILPSATRCTSPRPWAGPRRRLPRRPRCARTGAARGSSGWA